MPACARRRSTSEFLTRATGTGGSTSADSSNMFALTLNSMPRRSHSTTDLQEEVSPAALPCMHACWRSLMAAPVKSCIHRSVLPDAQHPLAMAGNCHVQCGCSQPASCNAEHCMVNIILRTRLRAPIISLWQVAWYSSPAFAFFCLAIGWTSDINDASSWPRM